MELITTKATRKGTNSVQHLFITTVRTTPEALLRLIRQRWSIENEWHWARDTQLGEDAPGPIKGLSQAAPRPVPDWFLLEPSRT